MSKAIIRKRLSEDRKDKIMKRHQNGESYQDIADAIGSSKSTVWRILNESRHKSQMAQKKDLQRAHTTTQMAHTMPQMLDLQMLDLQMLDLQMLNLQMMDLQIAQ
jgi:IS30 family transposase